MKKSELRKIIKEEIERLDEARTQHDYDLKNLGGGFDGRVYFDEWSMAKNGTIGISLGLYSGGDKGDHKYKLSKNLLDDFKDDTKDAYALRDKISNDISKGMIALLKKFDVDVKKLIDNTAKKHLK